MVAAIVRFPHRCHHFCPIATFVFICSPAMQQWSDCTHSHKRFTQLSLSTCCSLHPSLRLRTWASILTFKLASSNSFDSCCCLREREIIIITCEFPNVEERRGKMDGRERWMEGERESKIMQHMTRERERWGIRSDDPAGMRAERYFTGHQACFSLTCSLEKEIDFCPTRPLILLRWLAPVQRHSYIWKPLLTYSRAHPQPLWFHGYVRNVISLISLFTPGENNYPMTFLKMT